MTTQVLGTESVAVLTADWKQRKNGWVLRQKDLRALTATPAWSENPPQRWTAHPWPGKLETPPIWPDPNLLLPAEDYPSRLVAILLPYDALPSAAKQRKIAS